MSTHRSSLFREGDATVEAAEYVFNAETLPSGATEIAFDNIGAQPHHLIASPLKGDATAEDVEKFFKTEKGAPPLEEKGTKSTAVLEGGPPHALKGMVDEVEVE
ncbi:MAG: hypothetical protein QOF06_2287 [Solirubrobacterales bacterium]|nr:hypothetical protein [Solirubrobacterales bacterium]